MKPFTLRVFLSILLLLWLVSSFTRRDLFALGIAHAAEVQHVYDDAGRLKATIGDEVAIFSYDETGNLQQITRQSVTQLSLIDFAPKCGLPGGQITLAGSGFVGQLTVTFNGLLAGIVSSTPTQIIATIPGGPSSGLITVTTSSGSTTSSQPFTVGACGSGGIGAPTITGFSPTVGTPGTALTVTGANYATVLANNRVTLNTTLAVVTSATPTSITTSVPTAQGTSGRISVATPAGKAVSSADFFVPPAPFTAADVQATGRLTIGGSSTTLTTTTANKIGLAVFDGTQGQRVSLNLTNVTIGSSCCNTAEVALYNPDGTTLVSRLNFGRDGRFVGPVILPATGTYTILIDPTSTNKGSVTLTLYNVPPDVSGTLTINGSAAQVPITAPGQNAAFTFVGTAGQKATVRITANTMTSNGGVFVVLNNPSGIFLTSASSASSNFNLSQQTLPTTGTYTILIDPYGANTGSLNISVTNP